LTRCVEFYEKCQRQGTDWCEKCPESTRLIENYLELLAEGERRGIGKKTTIIGIPEGIARHLFEKRNRDIRDQLIDSVFSSLLSKKNPLNGLFLKKWTVGDIKRLILKLRNDGHREPIGIHGSATYKLVCGDFQEKGAEIPDEFVSFVLTDPPYGSKYLPLWNSLGELGQRVLVPGGFLVAYAGQDNLDKKLEALSNHLTYFWTFAILFTVQNVEHYVHVFNWWKPILVFYKPPLQLDGYIGDLIKGTGPEKDLHPWQQSEEDILRLIEYFCPQNGVLLDPMVGSGTTLAASLRLGRSCIGIDIDPQNIEVIKRRLGNGTGEQ
jgi:DNA modification methylase